METGRETTPEEALLRERMELVTQAFKEGAATDETAAEFYYLSKRVYDEREEARTAGERGVTRYLSLTHSHLRDFLNSVRGYPVLTPEEEYRLAWLFELSTVIEDSPTNNPEFDEGIKLYGLWAYSELMYSNVGLVVKKSERYLRSGAPFMDLIQEGMVGLHTAVRKFDRHKGFKFSTYAAWWVNQNISRRYLEVAAHIHVPDRERIAYQAYLEHVNRLTASLGREPEIEEVASEMGIEPEELRGLLEHIGRALNVESLDQDQRGPAMPDGKARSRSESLLHSRPDDIDFGLALEQFLLREQLEGLLDQLRMVRGGERLELVIRLRYGLGGKPPATLKEVSAELGLSINYVHKLEKRALEELGKIRLQGIIN